MFTKNNLIIILFLLSVSQTSTAQSIHFSQFDVIAPTLNPALTGFIANEDDLRVALIRRNQWSSFLGQESYHTTGASFDMRNCLSSTSDNNHNGRNKKFKNATWGLGFSVIHDETGVRSVKNISEESFPLIRDYVNISSALIFPINDRLLLNAGFRFGGQFHRIKTDHLRYDEQFDLVSDFDPSISGEFDDIEMLNSNMLDLSGGTALIYLNERFGGFSLGTSIDYVFRPVNFQFTEDEDQPSLARKFSTHGKFSIKAKKFKHSIISIKGKANFINQNPFQQGVAALDIIFQHKEGVNVILGSGFRRTRHLDKGYHNDAFIFSAAVNYQSFTFGFNYDLNVSELKVASQQYGALEFSVVYHWKKKNSKCSPAQEGGCVIDGKYINPMYF